MKTLVILGTARNESNTLTALQKLCPFSEYELIDLRKIQVNHYEYDCQLNQSDDFILIAQKMLEADNIVFATPVYWYSMSGRMKVFFDRLTELLTTHKTIGRGLKGKRIFLIASGTDAELPPGFDVPFRMTCDYFEMRFENAFYMMTD